MENLPEIVKILSEDSILMKNRLKFVHSLEISESVVAPVMRLHDMGNCHPYDLIHGLLSEWIATREEPATIAELRRILRGINLNLCAYKLRHFEGMHPGPITIPGLETFPEIVVSAVQHSTRNPPPTVHTPIVFGVKDVVLNFMGREEELAILNQYFHSRNCRSVLLSGLGGIGKTELAKKFTFSFSDPSGNNVKSWLAGESPQALLNSTMQFCHYLRLSATGSDGQCLGIQEMLQNIFTKIKSTAEYSRWFLVIDNVDETHQEFEAALETLLSFGTFVFLLVTSRRRDIPTGELMEVAELKLQDSVAFVRNSLKIPESASKSPILALCAQLGNFPLALNQAVAYIKQQQRQSLTGAAYGVQNYLDELAKKETLGLDKDLRFAEYPKATLKVWNLTLDKIEENHGAEGKTALDLLNIMAFTIPDNIHTPCLQKLFRRFYTLEETDLNHIHSCLTILLQYSLISSYNTTISIHRLVQLSLRKKMTLESKSNQHNQTWDVELLKSFWASFDHKEWSRGEIPNILKIWKHSYSHSDLHEELASKSHFLSQRLYDIGMVNESYDFATECRQFLFDLYGPENKQYLLMEHRLAIATKEKGHYESSLKKFKFAYVKLKELCGENDWHTLNTGHWIASVLLNLQRYKESLEWGQRVLQSRIRIYGENNNFTMRTKHNVAVALRDSRKGGEALKMFHDILKWEEVHLRKDHPSTLLTKHNIALCFYNAGKYSQALGIFQGVLALREIQLGVDHPNTLLTKQWLAKTLDKMGEIGRALKIMEDVAVAREKLLGPDHPRTTYARNQSTLIKNKIKKYLNHAGV